MNEQNPNNDPRLTEALHSAYPSQTPGDQLEGRMVDAERYQRVQSYRPRSGWRKGWLVLLGSLAILSVLGFTVYKIFFDRPGEAAISLIPSDADIVMTLDTNPSSRQIATFQKIADALKREGILEKVDDLLTMTLDQNPAVRQIRPKISKNLALAVWMPAQGFAPGQEPEGVAMFLALSDTGAVRDTLTKWVKREERDGLTVYAFDKGSAAIISNYLVIAQKPELLSRISQVERGKAESIAQLQSYKEARASLADDANFMFFMSPDALNALDKTTKGAANGVSPFGAASWLAMGMALRDQGLEFTYQCPMDQGRMPALRQLAGIKPIDPQILNRLPGGAYGVLAYSQPSKLWGFLSETAANNQKDRLDFENGMAAFEKETGMSIPRDIVPAFDGNFILAVYPSPTMGAGSADGLIVLDDANDANPAATAAKVRELIERKSAKDGKTVRFISDTVGGATIWRLDKESQDRLRSGLMGKDSPAPTSGAAEALPPDIAVPHESEPLFMGKNSGPNPRGSGGPNPMQDKTIIYAQIGNAVLIASSEAMLNKAVQAYKGQGSTLAGDPAFAFGAGRLRDGAQDMIIVNLYRIMEAVKPQIEQSGVPFNVDDFVNLFGGPGVSLAGSASYDGKLMTGEMFMPLDYERLIRMIGAGVRKSPMQRDVMSMETAPESGIAIGRAASALARL